MSTEETQAVISLSEELGIYKQALEEIASGKVSVPYYTEFGMGHVERHVMHRAQEALNKVTDLRVVKGAAR